MNAPRNLLPMAAFIALAFLLAPLVGALALRPAPAPIVDPTPTADDEATLVLPLPIYADNPLVPLGAEPGLDDGEEYGLRVKCPPLSPQAQNVKDVVCPMYILDEEDAMGQPDLILHPRNADVAAFHALHGRRGLHPDPTDQPATNRSRDDGLHQPHTVFQWRGSNPLVWEDNRYYSPWHEQNGHRTFGEDNAAAVDAQGRGYFASLYTQRENAAEPYHYLLVLFKADDIGKTFEPRRNFVALNASEPYNVIDSIHLVHEPASDRVAALWRESVPEELPEGLAPAKPQNLKSWIGVASTKPGEGGVWNRMRADQGLIGPCRQITNPVAAQGLIYVGCFPDAGYPWAEDNPTLLSHLHIHAIDLRNKAATYIGPTPLLASPDLDASGPPRLVASPEGYTMLVYAGMTGEGGPFVDYVKGRLGSEWDDPRSFASSVANDQGEGAAPILEVRIQDAAYVSRTGNVFVVYMERYGLDPAEAATAARPEFFKRLVSISFEGNHLDNYDLPLGGPVTQGKFDATTTGVGSDAFNDLHDGLFVWRAGQADERVFLAYGDYGFVRFGEFVEDGALPAVPIVPAQVAPLALANPGTNPSLVAAGAAVLSGVVVTRLLTAKKKKTVEAPAL